MNPATFLAAILSLLLSGCLETCLRPKYSLAEDWEQEGLFDAFPPQGRKGDFEVTHHWNTVGSVGRKSAVATAEDEERRLEVRPDGGVFYRHSRAGELSHGETWASLNATFAELGLPAPTPGAPAFDWTKGSC